MVDLGKVSANFETWGKTSRGKDILALTSDDVYSTLTYFDVDPWHPDGRRILYSQTILGDNPGRVCMLDLESGVETVLGEVERLNLHTGANVQWGPGGKGVYYFGRRIGADQAQHTHIYDPETGETESLSIPSGRVNPSTGATLHSSDGAQSVCTSPIDGSGPQVLARMEEVLDINPKRDLYSKQRMVLTHTKWSPTGERCFFLLDDVNEDGVSGQNVKEVYIVNADGTGLRWINSIKKHPGWTFDGRRILFWGRGDGSPDDDSRIYILDVDEERPVHRPISKNGIPSHPLLSPDGRWVIADRRPRNMGTFMHLVDVSTGEDEVLVEIGRPETLPDGARNPTHGHPTWDADSSIVLFNAHPGKNSRVFLMPI